MKIKILHISVLMLLHTKWKDKSFCIKWWQASLQFLHTHNFNLLLSHWNTWTQLHNQRTY